MRRYPAACRWGRRTRFRRPSWTPSFGIRSTERAACHRPRVPTPTANNRGAFVTVALICVPIATHSPEGMKAMHTSRITSPFVGIVLIAALAGCGTSTTSAPAAATKVRTYVAGSSCFGNAIDSSGNIWVANGGNGTPGTAPGDSNVTKLSPSGTVIGTYVAGTGPIGMAIDLSLIHI